MFFIQNLVTSVAHE